MKNKVVDRKNVQWTLADWLAQKKKFAEQDRWLAMNRSPNRVDLTLSGGYRQSETEPAATKTATQSYSADLFLTIFNLYGEYELSDNDLENYGGALGLRLWGNSSQDTSLVARYGWRRLRDHESFDDWEQQYAEGILQLYIFSFFGLEGKYRHYLPATSDQGVKLEGSRQTAGAFLEFSIFRIYAAVFSEPIEREEISQKQKGYEGGLRLMF